MNCVIPLLLDRHSMMFATLTVITLLLVFTTVSSLECYNTEMESDKCPAMLLWCVEWTNGTTVSRGCADVILCPDEEDGCYPEHEQKTAAVKWCCCKSDFCNSSQSFNTIACFVVLLSIIMLFCNELSNLY